MIININKSMIPYTFDLDSYTFTIKYNMEFDYFTVDVELEDELIVYGDKIVYGRPLFAHLKHLQLPTRPVVPLEIADKVERVTWDNLGEKVFLYLGDDYE